MSDEKIKELENAFDALPVEASLAAGLKETHGHASPAGDVALVYLDKAFSSIKEYLSLKLKDGVTKTIVLAQISYLFAIVRTAVEHALS